MDKFYVTTTLPYVNAAPHVGFALEIVQADILARWHVQQGHEVFFNTGTDEHGLKMYRQALVEKMDPQDFANKYSATFRHLKESLNLYPNLHFIRTTDTQHIAAAQAMWQRCEQNGDIYKKKYSGLYCVGDEAFVKEGDLVDGRCPNHPHLELAKIEEENYFFRLTKYQDKLLEYLSRDDVITPNWRREEALAFVKAGLEDFSISREHSRLPWGIPVPGDDTQTMYVWFDALTNYISTLGWPEDIQGNFQAFWVDGHTMQCAGKDQVRFQSIMWQAMLMSAGLPTTDTVNYHGFINSGGQKMSKSLGNVIDPITIVNDYGTDALRYYLARHIHPWEDSDFTMERFKNRYNSDLANGLGNLVSRVLNMIEKFWPSFSPPARGGDGGGGSGEQEGVYPERSRRVGELSQKIEGHLHNLAFDKALAHIWEEISRADQLIEETKPWELAKQGKSEKVNEILQNLYVALTNINQSLAPFMPVTHQKISVLLNTRPLKKPSAPLFARKE